MRRFMVLAALTLVLFGVLLPARAALPTYSCTATQPVAAGVSGTVADAHADCAFELLCVGVYVYEARVDVNSTGIAGGFWQSVRILDGAATITFFDGGGDPTTPPDCIDLFACSDPDTDGATRKELVVVASGAVLLRVVCRGQGIALFEEVTCSAAATFEF
jgi:hypothetical protein